MLHLSRQACVTTQKRMCASLTGMTVSARPHCGGPAALQVRLADGEVCDRFTVTDDFVQLNHAHGAHLLGDRLAVLALRSQQHHLLQVRAARHPRAAYLHAASVAIIRGAQP